MKEVIGSRSEKQIQSHYQKYLKRVSKNVKKLKRKDPMRPLQDHDLETECQLYQKLFTAQDLTANTPSQIRNMVVCACLIDSNSPRLERNIIITDSSLDSLQQKSDLSSTAKESSTLVKKEKGVKKMLEEEEQWNPHSLSFWVTPT